MRELNKRIAFIDMPSRMRGLPISDEGYPIPYFVPIVDGKPEFRGMDGEKLAICVRLKRCWLCGQPLGVHMTFPIGSMCCITRSISEPPSHHACAEYGVRACPFLTQPRMKRNEKDVPAGTVAGIGILRNPGVTALWTTQSYRVQRAGAGVLFIIGNPEHVEFYREGRTATREEILESIHSGLPILEKIAADEGPEALADLTQRVFATMRLLPLPPEEKLEQSA